MARRETPFTFSYNKMPPRVSSASEIPGIPLLAKGGDKVRRISGESRMNLELHRQDRRPSGYGFATTHRSPCTALWTVEARRIVMQLQQPWQRKERPRSRRRS